MNLDLVTHKELAPLMAKYEALAKRLEELERLQDEWVDTKTAMRLTGVSRTTLTEERERPGTKLEYKYEGSKPLYSRASIFSYNESRKIPKAISIERTMMVSRSQQKGKAA